MNIKTGAVGKMHWVPPPLYVLSIWVLYSLNQVVWQINMCGNKPIHQTQMHPVCLWRFCHFCNLDSHLEIRTDEPLPPAVTNFPGWINSTLVHLPVDIFLLWLLQSEGRYLFWDGGSLKALLRWRSERRTDGSMRPLGHLGNNSVQWWMAAPCSINTHKHSCINCLHTWA